MSISKKLIVAVKLSNRRHYEIAHEVGVHPSTFSRIITGIEKVKENDSRVIAIGRALGLNPEDCFMKNKGG